MLCDGEKEVFYLFGGGVIFVTLFSYVDCYKGSFCIFNVLKSGGLSWDWSSLVFVSAANDN